MFLLYIFIYYFYFLLTKYYLTVFLIFQLFFKLWIYPRKPGNSQNKGNEKGMRSFSLSREKMNQKLGFCSSGKEKRKKWSNSLSLLRAITRHSFEEIMFFNELQKRRRIIFSSKALSSMSSLFLKT